mmetsp:Transcript_59189/g.173723  ORF Transcript_59189/g.173723 Transcript_59189/m.173723 type:complete len:93 (+) Transcript_59189:117-395(+)
MGCSGSAAVHSDRSAASWPQESCKLAAGALQVEPEVVRRQFREVTPEDCELLCLLDKDLTRSASKAAEDAPVSILVHVTQSTSIHTVGGKYH